jgi:hypothetical protein
LRFGLLLWVLRGCGMRAVGACVSRICYARVSLVAGP